MVIINPEENTLSTGAVYTVIHPMEAGTRIGAYEIVKLLGAGGMARVFLAQDSRLGRKVALKVLPQDAVQNPERVRRFEQEARAASALNHPNILTIYEIGDIDSTKFIATEFVEGATLGTLIAQGLPLPRALDIGQQAAGALASAHASGIVHRDIKPENIMVRPDGFVKILDFGLAKLSQAGLDDLHGSRTLDVTMPGVIMGTLAYMSPEQLRGQEVDARTDIWSLGAVFYELFSQKSPFAAPTTTDTMVAVVEREPQPLRQLRPDLPDELERIVIKMLAKDREERYQTMKDVASDLRRLKQRVESGEQQRISESVRVPEQPKRVRRLPLLLGTAVLLGLLMLAGALWFGRSRESQQSSARVLPNPTPAAVAPPEPPEAAAQKAGGRRSATKTMTVPGAGSISIPAPPETNLVTNAGGHQLTYYLAVQKMQNGKPVGQPLPPTGKDSMVGGGQFSIVVSTSQDGALYLIKQSADGNPSPLFPTNSMNHGKSMLKAGGDTEIGPFRLDENAGKEKLWIVWSALPIVWMETEIKLAENSAFMQYASGSHQPLAEIKKWLVQHQQQSAVAARSSEGRIVLTSQKDPLVALVELEHK